MPKSTRICKSNMPQAGLHAGAEAHKGTKANPEAHRHTEQYTLHRAMALLANRPCSVLDCSAALILPEGAFPAGHVTNTSLSPSPFSN